nr:glycosyl hydrolase [uncultured Draconibacterium sp.]
MNRILFLVLIVSVFWQSCTQKDKTETSGEDQISYSEIRANFENPAREYGVNCWWWWLNGNVNKAAITKDMEAMKSKNFQGAMIFDAGGYNQRGNKDIPKGPLYGSDEWNELFVFALDEAKRLGLTMGFNIQSGWNLGGPRVTPQYAAKQLTFSEAKVEGEKTVSLKLEQPFTRDDFYKDITILAFPLKETAKTDEVITDLDYKLGFHELGGSAPDCRFLLFNDPDKEKVEGEKNYTINKEEIVQLDAFVSEDGTLNWDAPPGNWNIMRVGYTCTDAKVSTSSGDWQGRVLDYMSEEAFDFYWNDVVEPIFEAAGDHVGTTLKYMETDSWECGGMNWTDKFAQEFTDYRGYDVINYLPVVAGYIVDDVKTTNAFLADFRKTLADLVAEKHYKRFQEYAHQYNMGIQPESAGPHAGPMDGIKNYGYNDIVMSEFWAPSPHRPRDENRFFLKQASSAAHIYGIKIVGAESFTTIGPHWNDELWHDQKSSFDHEICAGLNRMYFHTFTCSPPEMGLPGQEYFAGTHVNPQVTWWNQSGAFIDYMQCVQAVVQEGKFVADALYYYGDHVPNVFPYKHSDPAGVMPGFDYDVTDETIFLQLKVNDGKVVVPGGIEYSVLVLPDHKVLSLAVLEKLEELVNQGATVIGNKPERPISLVGGKAANEKFQSLANKLWGNDTSAEGTTKYGDGKVVWGVTAREYLLSQSVAPDFSVKGNNSKTDFDYIHYTVGKTQVYFVSNQTAAKQKITAEFRESGTQPELWDANTGDIRDALAFRQADGKTEVPLTLEPYGSVMVVFNASIPTDRQGVETRNYPEYKTVKTVDSEWELFFEPEWGGPGKVVFPELADWSKSEDQGIKYYSGKVVYTKTFNLDFAPEKGRDYFLQLETVKDVGIAEVTVNGKYKGITWTKPFRLNISDVLQQGENTLEITVVNSWFNRVAGDEILDDQKKYTSTNIVISNDFLGRKRPEINLEPSGLLGPVTIRESVLEND